MRLILKIRKNDGALHFNNLKNLAAQKKNATDSSLVLEYSVRTSFGEISISNGYSEIRTENIRSKCQYVRKLFALLRERKLNFKC